MTTEKKAGTLTEEEYEQLKQQAAIWQEEYETFWEHFMNPDYDHWAKMDFWNFDEALLLSINIKPPTEVALDIKLQETVLREPGGCDYDNIHYKQKFDQRYMDEWVRPLFSKEVDSRKQLMGRAGGINTDRYRQTDPAKFVNWAGRIGLDLPVEMVEAVKKYHPEKTNTSDAANCGGNVQEPLSGEERRELGMLKQQKERWEKSIEATVEAVLIAQKKKITRDELTQHLDGFDLPFTTLEVIWKSLREKGFTKGAGRPAKEKEKNP